MKDEIKEILDKLTNENNYQVDCNDGSAFKELFANEIHLLLDYITNLQEERDNLKTALDESTEIVGEYKEENKQLQKRINETTEYLKYQISQLDFEKEIKARMLGAMAVVLLQGDK